jgi:hypothetical protein
MADIAQIPLSYTVIALFPSAPPEPESSCTDGQCIPHPDWDTTGWDKEKSRVAKGGNYISGAGPLTVDVDGKATAITSVLVRQFETEREATTWIESKQGVELLRDAERVMITCNSRAWERPKKR